ncbi:murein biosynthesis integral membrane protein MurJ [Streptococcus ruminantium]|uniref:murein biosynthesis integral membrane protein MurJ n=1 Tax=Streptococcus ruminantium TaxID=1917441 RepID=UPI0012DE8E56|nr:oligosaccharide flippase family protein [Streptococcus ruminantium]
MLETKRGSQNKKNIIQLILMIVLTCFSQILALYKSRFTAINFGATHYMDAYNFSVEIAAFVFSFVIGGVTTIIIPAYVKKTSSRAVNTFITVTYACVLLLTLGVVIFRQPLLRLLTGRGIEFINIASDFLIISFIIQGVTAFLSVTLAYYQCEDKYNIPKVVVSAINMIILIVLLLGVVSDIYLYFLLLIAGSIINLVIDVAIAFKLGFRYTFCLDIKNIEFKKMMAVFLPTVLSSGVYKLQTIVGTTIATNLAEGQITILGYASQIITVVNTVIIGNLTVYIYPKIVANLKNKNVLRYFWDYCIFFHGVLAIIISGFINIGSEGLSLLFLGGKFTLDNVNLLYLCSCIYIYGQQFNIIRDLIYRYFYAHGNTKETFKNSVVISLLNILLNFWLVKIWGIYGIVFGTVLAGFISLGMIIIRFQNIFGLGVKFRYIVVEMGKNTLAMGGAVFFIQWLKTLLDISNVVLSIFVYGTGTVVIYLILILMLKTKMRHIKL